MASDYPKASLAPSPPNCYTSWPCNLGAYTFLRPKSSAARRLGVAAQNIIGSIVSLLVLGGSWVVTSRVKSPLILAIIIVTLLRTPLITTHGPPRAGGAPRLRTCRLMLLGSLVYT